MSKKKSMIDRKFGIGILVFIGLLIIVVAIYSLTTTNVVNTSKVPANEAAVRRISLNDAKAAYDQGTALFVDVRDPSSFAASHIPGAVNIPLADIESGNVDLNPDQWIITYCT